MEIFYLQRVTNKNNNPLIYNVLSIVNKRVVSIWGIGKPPKGDKVYLYKAESLEKAQRFIEARHCNKPHKTKFIK